MWRLYRATAVTMLRKTLLLSSFSDYLSDCSEVEDEQLLPSTSVMIGWWRSFTYTYTYFSHFFVVFSEPHPKIIPLTTTLLEKLLFYHHRIHLQVATTICWVIIHSFVNTILKLKDRDLHLNVFYNSAWTLWIREGLANSVLLSSGTRFLLQSWHACPCHSD